MSYERPVFFVPGRPGIIDTARLRPDGVLVGTFSGETVEEIGKRYPGTQIGELATVAQASAEAYRRPPEEITRERFIEMLEVLPPEDWQQHGATDSFKLSERTYGPITPIFARIGQRYFTLSDSFTLSHAKIIEAVRAAFPEVA